jgi:hypothetical protein
MKIKLSLLTFTALLFVIPGKAQQDTSKAWKDAHIIHFDKADSLPQKHVNYKNDEYFIISTDLAQDAFFQPNLGVDHKLNRSLSIGLNVGYLIPSPLFRVNPLANGQFTDPGTVYRGLTLRLNIKFYLNKDKPGNYFCLQAVYKYLEIADERMGDDYGDEAYNDYDITEKTNTLGADAIFGHITGDENSTICADLFFGIGAHFRIRNYTIFNDNSFGFVYTPPGTPGYTPPTEFEGQPIAYNGTYNVVTPIFAIVLGVKFVFRYSKKAN